MGAPLVFLNLQIRGSDGKREIRHWPTEMVVKAPECVKAQTLQNEGDNLKTQRVQMLTTEWEPQYQRRDVSGLQPVSCCAFFGCLAIGKRS